MSVSWSDIADLLFPDIDKTIADYEHMYPLRPEGKIVTRFAPSPTGFLHIGGVYSALVAQKFAAQSDGVFFLRMEDTDQQRQVGGGIQLILDGLQIFGITIHEGAIGPVNSSVGDYGPYIQSQRKDIYRTFVKHLVAEGKAYPCWMSQEELDTIRDQQMKSKLIPGIYGNYSVRRNKSPEDIAMQLKESYPPVIRLRSHANTQTKIIFDDMLRGKVTMTDNFNDIVLLKSDGLPTYHLAHLVDDYLMRTTHVIRAEEWLTSVPLHLQLFEMFGFQAPIYCHLAPLLKMEDGKKRKLSKRKDPEADISFFWAEGFAPEGVIDYLMTIINPSFEAWLQANPDNNYHNFSIQLENMNKAGALFDLDKLKHMNNRYLSRLSNEELFAQGKAWAEKYHPTLATYMTEQPDYALAAVSIERHTEKDPKRYSSYKDLVDNLLFFFDDERAKMVSNKPALPDNMTQELLQNFVVRYSAVLDLTMDVHTWFDQLKAIGKEFGFAANNQEFKEGNYIGKIGDLAMFLRVQLCCASRTPDLYCVMQVMGRDRVIKRLSTL